MLNNKTRESINECVLCWLATIAPDGSPSVSPKEMFTHHGEDTLLIVHIASPNSVRNLQQNPQVCVSMVEVFKMRGFQFYGTAEILSPTDNPEYTAILAEMAGSDFPVLGVICIKITKIKPVLAPSYKLFPERTDAERIASEMQTYGVNPA